ncbi:MAG TPA: ABC transporter ATP-binding protein [Ramlibacter sp.]|nr:ABC transporter ATP-binding protein [Ramlibacter sp.]
MSEYALEATGLTKHWGQFVANDKVDLQLRAGERHALIGPNGAGKSTLVHLLTGYLEPSAGQIALHGERLTTMKQHQRVRRGMARTFQINTLFAQMSVAEAVLMGVAEQRGLGSVWWRSAWSFKPLVARVDELLHTLGLQNDAGRKVGELPYGKQRIVEIALALSSEPRVLLLDEPAAGIPAEESRELFSVIAALPRTVTILIIEHDMDLVFRFAERITVLVGGKVFLRGTPDQVSTDQRVQEIYLGDAADD